MIMVHKGFTEEEAIERAGKVFESLDKNNDGGLAEDEFVKVVFMHIHTRIRKYVDQGCLEDGELLQLLNASPGAEDEKKEEEIEVKNRMTKSCKMSTILFLVLSLGTF